MGCHGSLRRPDPDDDTYESVGPRRFLDRLLAEYDLREEHVRDKIRVRTDTPWVSGGTPEAVYLVHQSLLRSHGEFPCAGDNEALTFCREIAEEMVRAFGTTYTEAVARINRQWSTPGASGREPRIWIVGLDIAYHQSPADWAGDIYYGQHSLWRLPDAHPRPLPPP